MDCEVLVIGAGVIGLACAERFASAGRSVIVIERHPTFGQETSSRSSEVIHAGLYYPTGSLKAELCVEGRRLLLEWCRAHGVRHALVGKLIVATTSEEETSLAALQARAMANGITSIVPITGAKAREMEPRVRAMTALWSPESGIFDSHGFMRSLVQSARDHGCQFAWNHRVIAVKPRREGWRLQVSSGAGDESLDARVVINAAGLRADEVAELAGFDVDACGYRQLWVKGRYFRIRRQGLVSRLVYPVPPANLPGLGIHVTVDLEGGARLGPDVEPLTGREERYGVPESAVPAFVAAASRYLEGLAATDLIPDQAGIRPRLSEAGAPSRDFVVAEESAGGHHGWVNLIGIESPGLTASLAIAAAVEILVRERGLPA
jgi:L-2-hydroxyglutarate oxidase LhgO